MLHTKALDHWPLCSRGDDFERFYQAFSSECVAKKQYFLTKQNVLGTRKNRLIVMLKLHHRPSRISAYSVFSGSLFHVFTNKIALLSGEQEKESIIRKRMG